LKGAIDKSKYSIGSVNLNSFLDSNIAQEDEIKSNIRDIAPTFSGRYLESKRKLFSRESKERDNNENRVQDLTKSSYSNRPISPSRGNKSPTNKGILRSLPNYQTNEKGLELVGVKQELPIFTQTKTNTNVKPERKDLKDFHLHENSEDSHDSIDFLGPTVGSDLYRLHIEKQNEEYFRSAFIKPAKNDDSTPLVVQATKKDFNSIFVNEKYYDLFEKKIKENKENI